MGAFIVIVIGVTAGIVFCMYYISRRTAAFPLLQRISHGNQRKAFWISLLFYLAVFAVLCIVINPINAVICVVHFGGFCLLCELLFYILHRITHRKFSSYLPGLCAMALTVCYMISAWYLCTHVKETDYSLESSSLEGDLRIVQIADSHMGATFDAQKFHDYILEINELHPDLVAITGDFVDDDTSRENMIEGCKALGDLDTIYGVYFCYGNHDRGYFSEEGRGWTNDELQENLEKNGVTVLEDEAELVDDRFYVIGRKDKSVGKTGEDRMTAGELMSGLDPDLYKIVLDHQPCEYDELAQAGADLVLGGHTHGGQFLPFNDMGVLTRQYERSKGHEKRGDTDFIVTTGISDWSLIFKTGCQSEYVVADVHGTE